MKMQAPRMKAKNTVTGKWYKLGEDFNTDSRQDATELSDSMVACIRYCYDNVEFYPLATEEAAAQQNIEVHALPNF